MSMFKHKVLHDKKEHKNTLEAVPDVTEDVPISHELPSLDIYENALETVLTQGYLIACYTAGEVSWRFDQSKMNTITGIKPLDFKREYTLAEATQIFAEAVVGLNQHHKKVA